MKCRLSPVRRAGFGPPIVPPALRVCGLRECSTLVLVTEGASDTNRCTRHQGVANEPESDEAFNDRVAAAMGWRRTRQP